MVVTCASGTCLIFMPAAGLRDKGPDIKEVVVQCCWIKGLCTDRVYNSPGVHCNCILWFPSDTYLFTVAYLYQASLKQQFDYLIRKMINTKIAHKLNKEPL